MKSRGLAGVAAGVAVLALGAGAATTASSAPAATPPGIAILPDIPEPDQAQFVAGASNYVAPTAPPAQDIRPRRVRSATPGFYTCPGFSGIERPNPVANLYRDLFAWLYSPYKVGDGKGNINWQLNPYKNVSWYMWFHSLRWLGQGIIAAGQGDLNAMTRVNAIAHDWYRDNPYSWKSNLGAWESTMHRTNVLMCLRLAVMSGLQTTTLPPSYAWLNDALVDHAKFLIANWSGAWNHGTDESIALFGVGCTLGRSDYKQVAQSRLATAITTSIDPQGATNEQSTGYAAFNYRLWGRAVTALQNCGVDPGTTITRRRALLANFLALATNSLGKLHQLGDTEVQRTEQVSGTPMEYAGSLGSRGLVPSDRVGIYSAGYAFGRTGWGETRTFTSESAYSIRFGPARAFHGHVDHTAITYTARGRDILIDSGSPPYADRTTWRPWARSSSGHSMLTAPASKELNPATKLNRSGVKAKSEFYEFVDVPATGVNRVRGVLVLKDPDLIVSLDRAWSKTAQSYQTLWHLPPDQRATIYSRTTAVATAPGDSTRTIVFQVPYGQALPPGAILVKQGQTNPIQGWYFPTSDVRQSAPTLLLARTGSSTSILSFVVPIRTNGKVTYATRRSGTTFIVDLNVGGQKVSVGISGGGSLFRATP
jgi:hypothetical protein